MSYQPAAAGGLSPIGVWTKTDISTLATTDAEINNSWAGSATVLLAQPAVKAGRLEALAVKLSGDVGAAGNDLVVTVYKNSVATLLTATITGGAGTEDEVVTTVTPITFVSGDDIAVFAKRVGTPGAVQAVCTVFARLSSVSGAGDSVVMGGDVTGGSATSTVEKIRGKSVNVPVLADDGQFARYNDGTGTISWEPASGGGGEANTASNVGTAGVGVFKQKTGVDLEFKKINAGSSKITITDDTGSSEVDIDVDATATPTASKIPVADGSGLLDGWVSYRPGGTDVAIADGGTGQSTATAGFNALAPPTTKGDIVVHDGTDNIRVAVGTNTHVLTADSAQASGVKWAAAAGGAATKDPMHFRQVGTSPLERWYVAGSVFQALSMTASSTSFGVMRAFPFLTTRGGTLDRLAVRSTVNAAGAVCRIGIYQATSDTNLYPNALVVDSGEIDISTSGMKTATISQALTANTLYWFVLLLGVANVTMAVTRAEDMWVIFGTDNGLAATSYGVGLSVAQAYGALPDPFTAGGAVLTAQPLPAIGCRFSA